MKKQRILFIYDAKNTDPNGDINEPGPRYDYETSRAIVTDVRIKRYVRDNILMNYGKDIFYRLYEDDHLDATDAVKKHTKQQDMHKAKQDLLKLADSRLFGILAPIKAKKTGEGTSVKITGPVQFNEINYSVNECRKVTADITSIISGRSSGSGNIGKIYAIDYAVFAIGGRINPQLAEAQGYSLNQDDIDLLDKALWDLASFAGRSKQNQTPLLYMRFDVDTFEIRPEEHIKVEVDNNNPSDTLRIDLRSLVEKVGIQLPTSGISKSNEAFVRVNNACKIENNVLSFI